MEMAARELKYTDTKTGNIAEISACQELNLLATVLHLRVWVIQELTGVCKYHFQLPKLLNTVNPEAMGQRV